MMKAGMIWTAALFAAGFGVRAETYPLLFKAVTAEQMEKLPGGYGLYGNLSTAKPTGIKKEPKPVSKHALYGPNLGEEDPSTRYWYRLDESKGDGQGYDQLIVDVNQNGDLTDDQVVLREKPLTPVRGRTMQPVWFGPIPGHPGKDFGGQRPVFFASIYVRARLPRESETSSVSMGALRLKAGWYLETTVELDGVKRKVAVYDGNNNLRLGEIPEAQNYQSAGEKSWYFRPADNFFVDANGSGWYESDPLETELRAFGPILYIGSKPFKASLEPNCASLRLEPWTAPLAEVTLEPNGGEVRHLVLAWEHPAGNWQLMAPAVENGKIRVPPGRYRFYYDAVFGLNPGGDSVMVSGNLRNPKSPFKFEAGKANTLRCGGPIEVAATARKQRPQTYELPVGEKPDPRTDSDYVVRINANFRGVGGETFSTFAKGPKLEGEPPKPIFKVLSSDGKQLAKGNLEFG